MNIKMRVWFIPMYLVQVASGTDLEHSEGKGLAEVMTVMTAHRQEAKTAGKLCFKNISGIDKGAILTDF